MRHTRDESGASAIELAITGMALLAAIAVIAIAGLFISAKDDVSNAAYAAARAASYATNPAEAQAAGVSAAQQALGNRDRSCATMTTTVDTSDFTPGGNVRVTIRCTTDIGSIAGLSFIPASKTFTATAVVPIDPHRVM